MLFSYVFSICVCFKMNIEVFLQIFLWFKFCTSVQICIYLPTFVLIYTLCNICCPTERYIRTVRIPGDLCIYIQLRNYRYATDLNVKLNGCFLGYLGLQWVYIVHVCSGVVKGGGGDRPPPIVFKTIGKV